MPDHLPLKPTDLLALQKLDDVCRQIAHCEYGNVDDLFALTTPDHASPLIRELAESFGFMLVQVEAREMRLTELVAELKTLHAQLEAANLALSKENAALNHKVQELTIAIDRGSAHREVGDIVETDYFKDLQSRAREMRARHRAQTET